MALVRFPEGQQRSGSTGGAVFSHNRFGAYIRARSVPVNPATDRQTAVRTALRNLAIYWHTVLTQAQRDAWDLYASNVAWLNAFGDECRLLGINHYIRSNSAIAQGGGDRVDDAPTIFDLAAAEWDLGASASEATQDISVSFDPNGAWMDETGGYQFCFAGSPQNPSIKFFNGPFRYLGVIAGDPVTPPTSPAALASPWPFVADQRIWVKTRVCRADGRLSQFAQVNFLAAV